MDYSQTSGDVLVRGGDPLQPPWWVWLEEQPEEMRQVAEEAIEVGRQAERAETEGRLRSLWREYRLTEILLESTIQSVGTAVGLAFGGIVVGLVIKESRR